ncbi:hypothetical protein GCM10027258_16360 [Amycolatopsis stemonae]
MEVRAVLDRGVRGAGNGETGGSSGNRREDAGSTRREDSGHAGTPFTEGDRESRVSKCWIRDREKVATFEGSSHSGKYSPFAGIAR